MREWLRPAVGRVVVAVDLGVRVGAVLLADVEDRVEVRLDLEGDALPLRHVELVDDLRARRCARTSPVLCVLAARRRPADRPRRQGDGRLARARRLPRRGAAAPRSAAAGADAALPRRRDPGARARRRPSRRGRTCPPPRGTRAATACGSLVVSCASGSPCASSSVRVEVAHARRRRSRRWSCSPPAARAATRASCPSASVPSWMGPTCASPIAASALCTATKRGSSAPAPVAAGRAGARSGSARQAARQAAARRGDGAASASGTGCARCRPAPGPRSPWRARGGGGGGGRRGRGGARCAAAGGGRRRRGASRSRRGRTGRRAAARCRRPRADALAAARRQRRPAATDRGRDAATGAAASRGGRGGAVVAARHAPAPGRTAPTRRRRRARRPRAAPTAASAAAVRDLPDDDGGALLLRLRRIRDDRRGHAGHARHARDAGRPRTRSRPRTPDHCSDDGPMRGRLPDPALDLASTDVDSARRRVRSRACSARCATSHARTASRCWLMSVPSTASRCAATSLCVPSAPTTRDGPLERVGELGGGREALGAIALERLGHDRLERRRARWAPRCARGGMGSWSTRLSVSASPSPLKRRRPASTSQSTTPIAKTSARRSMSSRPRLLGRHVRELALELPGARRRERSSRARRRSR